jgi:ComF family protein
VQEQLGSGPIRAVAAQGAQIHVEQLRHEALVRRPRARDKEAMIAGMARTCTRWALDFALPPRCAACGTVVDEPHSFCTGCWKQVEFLGDGGCRTCGLPLQATDSEQCAVCLARPPRIARTRSAVAYGDIARDLAVRLKYGRKVAIARTMARFMLPLLPPPAGDFLLVPVPLHRTRLWGRGFNQSALVARELARKLVVAMDARALRRTRRTPPLKGMSPLQRRKAVAGAFAVPDKARVAGKTVILIDDVLTTGSTAEACARTLKRAGATRVELVSWARVVRPAQLMR